jgi:RNA polymerase sigma factor (sigma-70 family)
MKVGWKVSPHPERHSVITNAGGAHALRAGEDCRAESRLAFCWGGFWRCSGSWTAEVGGSAVLAVADKSADEIAAYFHQILNREITNQVRQLRRERTKAEKIRELLIESQGRGKQSSKTSPLLSSLEVILGTLRATDRLLIELRFSKNLTHDRIAEQLGISPQASRARLKRALAEIAARIKFSAKIS